MDIIEKVIAKSEKEINAQISKLEKDIDFNPYLEALEILKELQAYLNNPNPNIEVYESLKKRQAKNERDKKRVSKPDYYDKLFKKQNELKAQLAKIQRLKFRYNNLNTI